MFARFTRIPLRRCLHTASTAAQAGSRLGRTSRVVLGASAAATAYLSYNLASDKSKIHLDSAAKSPGPSSATPPSSSRPSAASTPEVSSPTAGVDKSEETTSDGSEAPAQGSSSGGAYNPETGEINWDCACLGGMAHGPCGEQFKEAFSCFVFSEEEPKGINCVDAFKKMQDCFREHPEHYADEIMDDEDDAAAPVSDAVGDEAGKAGDVPDRTTTTTTFTAEGAATSSSPTSS